MIDHSKLRVLDARRASLVLALFLTLAFLIVSDIFSDKDEYIRHDNCVTHLHRDRSAFHHERVTVEEFCRDQ